MRRAGGGPPPHPGRDCSSGSVFPGASRPWLWTYAPSGAGFFWGARLSRGEMPLTMDLRPVRGGIFLGCSSFQGRVAPGYGPTPHPGRGFVSARSFSQGRVAPGYGPPPHPGRAQTPPDGLILRLYRTFSPCARFHAGLAPNGAEVHSQGRQAPGTVGSTKPGFQPRTGRRFLPRGPPCLNPSLACIIT